MKWTSIFVRPRSCQRWALMVMLGLMCPSVSLWAGNSNAENGINVTNELFQAQKIVKGVVTDESGVPLPGVAVKIKGQHVGTATDVSGHYQLTIDNRLDVVLEFSFMGMKTQEVKVGDRTEISVQLEALQTQLDEVMVVAYGTTKREAFTGSAVSVKSDKLTQAAASKTSPVQALQGNVAGVRFSNTSGQPGDLSAVQIRGIGSLNESTAPLYVVDGVTISAGLNMLNPEDIESMTVLKDAAATSLYGNRASNGVIIITTKKGREGKMRFSATYEHAWSMQSMPRSVKGFHMNTRELTEYAMEALQNRYLYDNDALPWQDAYDPGNTAIRENARNWALRNLHSVAKLLHPDDPLDGSYDYSTNSDLEKYLTHPRENNWEDALFRTGQEDKLNLSVTGGNEKLNFYGSLGYLDQKGIVVGSEYERFTGRTSVSGKLGRYIDFSLGESIGYSIKDEQTAGGGNYYYSNPIYGIHELNPSQPVYLPDGSLNPNPGYWNSIPNYVANLKLLSFTEKELSSISNLSLTVNFADWLNFRTVNGIDINYVQDKQIWKPESNDGAPTNGFMWQYASLYHKMTTSNTLNFNKAFGMHTLGALVGYEAMKYMYDNFEASGQQFAYSDLMYLGNAAQPANVGGYAGDDRMVSVISKLDYNYDNRYYLSGSFRRDGTSRFAPNNRWGNFWSLSGAWILSREQFMKGAAGWLDNLRLKLSYGTNGNQPSGYFNSLTLFAVNARHNQQAALTAYSFGNPSLTWENSYTWNAGVDFSVWQGALSGTIEYYNRRTTDLIDWTNVSYMTGWSSYIVNDGELRNTGLEITLNSRNFAREDFTWTTDFNISYMRAKVEKLKGDARISHPYITQEGKDIYSFYTREWAGVDPATGMGTWKKNTKNVDGVVIDRESVTSNVNEADRVVVGKGYPDWFGGLTNTFNYKGIELAFLLTFSLGGDMWDNTHYDGVTDGAELGNQNFRKDAGKDYWCKSGDHAKNPIVIHNNPLKSSSSTSTRRMLSSDHLRMKNVTIGYNLPRNWLRKLGVSSAKVYVNGNDVLTFSKSKYVDPEVGIDGMSKAIDSYPMLKSWRVGINLQF